MFEIDWSNANVGIFVNDVFHVKYNAKQENINYIITIQAVQDNFGLINHL